MSQRADSPCMWFWMLVVLWSVSIVFVWSLLASASKERPVATFDAGDLPLQRRDTEARIEAGDLVLQKTGAER